MDVLLDPNIIAGLLTLIVLEIVLGIDNLVFIAILADRLPPHQRDRARVIGLSLALFTRLALLASISWLVTLTSPVISFAEVSLSTRDLILLAGGLFLLFKATMEIHERLEGSAHARKAGGYASFGAVIAQIIVLDIVFSLDSVITAVGMVDELWVMATAVIVAVIVMIIASKPLTDFVGAHPTVVMLCLGFLLMIGLSLVAEAFHYEIPKGYLYAAIAFSIMVEAFNQVRTANETRRLAGIPLRQRTTDAVLRLLGGRPELEEAVARTGATAHAAPFAQAEREMVAGVMRLGSRTTRSIMTPRQQIAWLDIAADAKQISARLSEHVHSRYLVCEGEIDALRGVVAARDLLPDLIEGKPVNLKEKMHPALVVPDRLPVVGLMERLKATPMRLAVVVDDHGNIDGLVTPTDVLAAIAGDLVEDEDAMPRPLRLADGSVRLDGTTPIDVAADVLGIDLAGDHEFATVAGFALDKLGRVPAVSDCFEWGGWRFRIEGMDGRRVAAVLAIHPGERDEAAHG